MAAPASATLTSYLNDEPAIVQEALRRGAPDELLVAWLFWRRKDKRLVDPRAMVGDVARRARESLSRLVQPQLSTYAQMVTGEFNSLKVPFKDPDQTRSDLDHYFFMRPRYYVLGYTNPSRDIFNRIQPFTFLGKQVPGGLHPVFIDVLSLVKGILDATAPGLSDAVAAAIFKQDGGFVPRYIANSQVLSNHAFGLAIDFDPSFNPHIVSPQVIKVLSEVVKRRKGIDFNFDERYVARSLGNRVLTDEGTVKVTFLYARMASDAVRDWLVENLNTYEACLAQIVLGKSAGATSNQKILAKNAEDQIQADRDLQLLSEVTGRGQSHKDYPSLDTLHVWQKNGIQTIPVELAVAIQKAMRTRGFPKSPSKKPWGQMWEHSKDAMHFELMYNEAIPPDSQRRPLDALFEPTFLCSPDMFLVGVDLPGVLASPPMDLRGLVTSPTLIRTPR